MDSQSICVVGMGYIGLPTSIIFANKGFYVNGCDINPNIVNAINQCKPLIHEPELQERLTRAIKSGHLKVDTKPVKSDIFIIAVPTPVDHISKQADLSYVESAVRSIVPLLEKGNMVVLESTVPPGTTFGLLSRIILEHGLSPGIDVDIAHAPEKAIPGKLFFELENNDRVVGGIDEKSTERVYELYVHMTNGKLMKTDATTAEMVKLAENTYRDVNIALANEFSLLAERLGINIWEVIEYANRHPRVNIHTPGPGVGGHCIAVDPWFLVDAAPDLMRLVKTARDINDSMPFHTVRRIKSILNVIDVASPRVTIFGLTFKANVDDVRESPSITICKLLRKEGIQYTAYDPWVETNIVDGQVQSIEMAVQGSDLIVLLVAHDNFKMLDPSNIVKSMRTPMILDMKNGVGHDSFKRAGFIVYQLGGN